MLGYRLRNLVSGIHASWVNISDRLKEFDELRLDDEVLATSSYTVCAKGDSPNASAR